MEDQKRGFELIKGIDDLLNETKSSEDEHAKRLLELAETKPLFIQNYIEFQLEKIKLISLISNRVISRLGLLL